MTDKSTKISFYNRLRSFFPVRLIMLHLRKSFLLLAFWVVLFAICGSLLFDTIGIPYLFNTPEYMGEVAPLSYLIMGAVLGLFVMAYHICSYIFYSYRYPFLATLSRPLWTFSINNSIIPLAFYIYYSVVIAEGLAEESRSTLNIVLSLLSLYFGSILSITLVLTYFFSTIKSLPIKKLPEPIEKPLKAIFRTDTELAREPEEESLKVKYYLRNFITIKPTRAHKHYSEKQKLKTLQQHHLSAAIFFVLIFAILIVLSWFSTNPYLQIPAAASVILILTMYLMLIGALYSRFKTWTTSIAIVLVVGWNFLSGLPSFEKEHQILGIDYSVKSSYNLSHLERITSDDNVANDRTEMLKVLENWKAKFAKGTKPKMVLVNSSGGGLRSALWSLGVFQKLDSTYNGEFSKHTFLITGSSGGMIGSAYYRELSLQKGRGFLTKTYSRKYYDKMGQDILNPVGFSYAVNDMFASWKKVKVDGEVYSYDRGHAFEQKLLQNTDFLLDKKIVDYYQDEKQANIPMMILAPTVINEGRRLIISPLGLSFLARNRNNYSKNSSYEIDGIEFSRFFEQQKGKNLQFSSALRMSATFPYITPLVSLPSEPRIEVIDAGARDNDGFNLTWRFLHEFKEWIAYNTSGVIVVKMLADRPPSFDMMGSPLKTKIDAILKPVNGVYNSFSNQQEFSYTEQLYFAQSWLNFDLDIEIFSLLTKEDDISLSWHLTKKEQNRIYSRFSSADFIKCADKVGVSLGYNVTE